MKKSSLFIAFAVLSLAVLLAGVLPSCGGRMSEDDEERIFSLVYEPSAEGDYVVALRRADSLLSLPMGDTLRAYLMIEKNVAQYNSGDIAAARLFADTLIQYGYRTGLMDAVMQGEQQLGGSWRRMGENDSAIAHYRRGLEIAFETGSEEQEQVFDDNLAILYCEGQRYDEAVSFSRRSVEIAMNMGDTAAIISSLGTEGAITTMAGKYEETVATLTPYMEMMEGITPGLKVKFMTPLARSYTELGRYAEAEDIVDRMEAAASSFEHTHQAYGAVLSARSQLLGAQGKYREQWEILNRMDILGRHGLPVNRVSEEKAKCLAAMGDWRRAYAEMAAGYEELDSLRRSGIDRRYSELFGSYTMIRKDLQIEQMKHKHLLMTTVLLGCLLVIVVGASLGVILWQVRKKREIVERNNEYLKGLEEERGRMARELHDGIAGDLVGLQLAVRTLTADECSRRVGEIARRVRSLSHELCPPEFYGLSLSDLIADYVGERNGTDGHGVISLSVDGGFRWESLAPEVCHELYRIVQESVSNAIRHSDAGRVSIRLWGDDRYHITVSNDGVRGATGEQGNGIGIEIMKKRAEKVGAMIETTLESGVWTLTVSRI